MILRVTWTFVLALGLPRVAMGGLRDGEVFFRRIESSGCVLGAFLGGEVGHFCDPIVVERHVLAAGVLNALHCHVNHLFVKALIDVKAKIELFSDRLEHRGDFRRWCLLILRDECFLIGTGEVRSNFSEPMLLLVNSLLGQINLIDGLGRGVVDLGGNSSLADALPLFVDEAYEHAALLIVHLSVLLGHSEFMQVIEI